MTRIDRWLHEAYPVSARGLATFRIVYAALALLLFVPTFDWAGRLPDSLYVAPWGPMRLLDGYPSTGHLRAVELLLVVALVALLVGWCTRTASVAVTVLTAYGFGVTFGTGQVDSVGIATTLPAVFAITDWGAALSVDAWRRGGRVTVRAWPVAIFAAMVGAAMITSGWAKLSGGWLDPATQAVRGHLVNQYVAHGRDALLATPALHQRGGPVWEAADWATVALELSFVVAAFASRRWLLRVASAATVLHLVIFLVLDIAFVSAIFAYAAFLPWTHLAPSWAVPGGDRRRWWLAGAAVVGTGLSMGWFVDEHGPPVRWLVALVTDRAGEVVNGTVLVLAAAVGVGFLVREVLGRGKPDEPALIGRDGPVVAD